jgi:hypothetical protein
MLDLTMEADPSPWRRAAAIENTHPTIREYLWVPKQAFTNLALLWSSHDLIHPKFPTHLSI